MNQVIPIAIAADAGYLVHARVMLCSLFENNRSLAFTVFLFTEVKHHEELLKIKRLAKDYKNEVQTVAVDKSLVENFFISGHISVATYYRLLIPELVPEGVQKILYLDTDIIVKGNIEQLWEEELGEYCVGAVDDNTPSHAERLRLPPNSPYFNGGVLLINTQQWKERGITQKGLQLAQEYGDRLLLYDQDVLNLLLVNDWKPLSSKWNQMEGHRLGYLEHTPTIVHFVGPKPWSIHCIHPYRKEYYRYYYLMEGNWKRLRDRALQLKRAFVRRFIK